MPVDRTRPTRILPLLLVLCLLGARAAADEEQKPAPTRRATGHKDLVVDRVTHDFGVIGQNESRKTTFTYTNRSEQTVRGIAARGECGCNVVVVSHKELAPRESGTLDVEFNTLNLSGVMSKRVHLFSADHTRGRILIPVKIAIVKGLILRPGGLSFGNVLAGTLPAKSFSLRWYEGHGKPFEITEVSVPGFDFATRITPYTNERDKRWQGWSVEVTFKDRPPLGMFSAEVLVRTTDEKRARLTLPLSANVCGKIWMQSRTLSFGAFPRGKKRTASLKFRPFDKSVQFGEVKAVARKGKVAVEAKPDPLHAKAGVWRLYGTVAEDAEPGSLNDEVIELHTGVAGEEVTLVKVRGFVRDVPTGPSHDR